MSDRAKRVFRAAAEEFAAADPRRLLVEPLLMLLPAEVGNRTRAGLMRVAGYRIGRRTTIAGRVRVRGRTARRRIDIGADCFINVGLLLDGSGPIRIGDGVSIAQRVTVLTNTHEIGPRDRRAGRLRNEGVTIGAGAWIGASAVVLPGATIGPGAVVAAGSVVSGEVPADVLVAGVPARVKRSL